MTYENLVKAAVKAVKPVDVSVIKEHLAVEFDIEGKGEGAFYVEFSDKAIVVEPYEYYDHDFRVRTDADTAIAILNGSMSPVSATNDGKASVEGDDNKIKLLEKYLTPDVKEKTVKKAVAKRTTKKETAKVDNKKEAVKKPAVKKPVPKKVSKKPSTKTTK